MFSFFHKAKTTIRSWNLTILQGFSNNWNHQLVVSVCFISNTSLVGQAEVLWFQFFFKHPKLEVPYSLTFSNTQDQSPVIFWNNWNRQSVDAALFSNTQNQRVFDSNFTSTQNERFFDSWILVWTPCLMHRCVCIWLYI